MDAVLERRLFGGSFFETLQQCAVERKIEVLVNVSEHRARLGPKRVEVNVVDLRCRETISRSKSAFEPRERVVGPEAAQVVQVDALLHSATNARAQAALGPDRLVDLAVDVDDACIGIDF